MKRCRYSVGYITHPGNQRADNQDSLLVKEGALGGRPFALLAVADGMGGLSGGNLASAAAVDELERWWRDVLPGLLQPTLNWAGIESSLSVLPEIIHRRIGALGGGPSGSTLSLAFLFEERLLVFHVGDSRIYLIRDGACRQLTRDQTWCQGEVEAGTLSMEAAKSHPMRHVLVSTLGVGERFRLERSTHTLRRGDLLLLCSDGFYGELDLDCVCTGWPRRPVQACLEAAGAEIKRGRAEDNLTALLLRLHMRRQAPLGRALLLLASLALWAAALFALLRIGAVLVDTYYLPRLMDRLPLIYDPSMDGTYSPNAARVWVDVGLWAAAIPGAVTGARAAWRARRAPPESPITEEILSPED